MRIRVFALVLTLTLPFSFLSLDAKEAPTQGYKHDAFTLGEGAPGGVLAIAQTPDGFLWLGTYHGLYRYDGLVFQRMAVPDQLPQRSDEVNALLVDRQGTLWIGHDWGGVTLFRDGKFTSATPKRRFPYIGSIVAEPSGSVWAQFDGAKFAAPMRFKGGRMEDMTRLLGKNTSHSSRIFAASDGTVWLLLDGGFGYLRPGASRFVMLKTGFPAGEAAMAELPDHSIWLADGGQLLSVWNGDKTQLPRPSPVTLRLPDLKTTHVLIHDGTGGLWVGGAGSDLIHMRPSTSGMREAGRVPSSTLSSPKVNAVFVDREDNVWIGTELGLDRLRPVSISSQLRDVKQPRYFNPVYDQAAVIGGRMGTTLVVSLRKYFRVGRSGELTSLSLDQNAGTPCIDASGNLWSLGRQYLQSVRRPEKARIPSPPGVPSQYIDICLMTAEGTWISGDEGLYQLVGRRWRRVSMYPSVPLAVPFSSAIDRQGRLVAYMGNRGVYRYDHGKLETIWDEDHVPLAFINIMKNIGSKILMGGLAGLAEYDGRRVRVLLRTTFPMLDDVTGIAEDARGNTWLLVRKGLLRIRSSDLSAAFDDPRHALSATLYSAKDGLIGFGLGNQRNNVGVDAIGRIWIATNAGLFMLDPARARTNSTPPSVTLMGLVVDGVSKPLASHVSLPSGMADLRIDYTATALRAPNDVRFRYRLLGRDRDWVDAGARRQAIYTNLEPGTYRFEVMAANEDGVWSRSPAVLAIELPPTFLQSRLFALLCLAAILALLACLYRLRLAQVSARIRARMEERTGERERIARELHDTLLQSVQGLIYAFQNVADDLPAERAERRKMISVLDQADSLLAEGRNRVHDLRQSAGAGPLPEALGAAAERILAGSDIEASLVVTGEEMKVHAEIADELIRIAEEALANVRRHAGASNLVICLEFGSRSLCMSIKDDGVGLDAATANGDDTAGHFGLLGMQERAEAIGGAWRLASRLGSGTEITVTLPSQRAYVASGRPLDARLARWLRTFRRRVLG